MAGLHLPLCPHAVRPCGEPPAFAREPLSSTLLLVSQGLSAPDVDHAVHFYTLAIVHMYGRLCDPAIRPMSHRCFLKCNNNTNDTSVHKVRMINDNKHTLKGDGCARSCMECQRSSWTRTRACWSADWTWPTLQPSSWTRTTLSSTTDAAATSRFLSSLSPPCPSPAIMYPVSELSHALLTVLHVQAFTCTARSSSESRNRDPQEQPGDWYICVGRRRTWGALPATTT